MKALIDAGGELDAREESGQYTPLMFAAQKDTNLEVVKALVEAGADVNLQNSRGEGALYIAVKSYGTSGVGQDMLRYLLGHGADPHLTTTNGTSALEYVKDVKDKPGRQAAFGDLLDD